MLRNVNVEDCDMLRLFGIRWCAAAMCMACVVTGTAFGQEPDEAAAAEQAAEDKAAEDKAVDPLEHLIYVPYRNLKSVFEKRGASVIVPYEQFMKLLMSEQTRDASAAQVSAVITDSNAAVYLTQTRCGDGGSSDPEMQSGLLNRQVRVIPPERIQNVELTRNVFHRMSGLVEVRVETASGTDIEGQLSALSEHEALALMQVSQVVERDGDRGMLRAQHLLINRQ